MGNSSSHASPGAYIPAKLLASARGSPNGRSRVILQGAEANGEAWLSSALVKQLVFFDAAWGLGRDG